MTSARAAWWGDSGQVILKAIPKGVRRCSTGPRPRENCDPAASTHPGTHPAGKADQHPEDTT